VAFYLACSQLLSERTTETASPARDLNRMVSAIALISTIDFRPNWRQPFVSDTPNF
jgi:hypothetical protein